jgi:hypothetical protein
MPNESGETNMLNSTILRPGLWARGAFLSAVLAIAGCVNIDNLDLSQFDEAAPLPLAPSTPELGAPQPIDAPLCSETASARALSLIAAAGAPVQVVYRQGCGWRYTNVSVVAANVSAVAPNE